MMAAGEVTQGRRLPDAIFGEPSDGWDEWKRCEPGSYLKAKSAGHVHWHVTLPSGVQFTLGGHTVTEHDDGTITASPSVYDAPNGWHGWLERGVWRSC